MDDAVSSENQSVQRLSRAEDRLGASIVLLMTLALVFCWGCSSVGSAGEAALIVFESTKALIDDESLAFLVDELAKAPRAETRAIGPGAEKGETYRLYEKVAARVDSTLSVRLTKHESPIVRTYFSSTLFTKYPDQIDSVYPLLRDETTIETMEGCWISSQKVSEIVLRMMCNVEISYTGFNENRPRRRRNALEVLERVLRDPHYRWSSVGRRVSKCYGTTAQRR